MVGIISSNLYYGELQNIFGTQVDENQGLYKALSNGGDTKYMFVQISIKSNVFFLSVPNNFDSMLLTTVSGDIVKDMIEDATMRFDYLIIDGSEELNNPISSMGLVMSSQVFIIHKVNVKDCVWYNAVSNMMNMLKLDTKSTHILNAYDKSCDKLAYATKMKIPISYELDFIDKANIYENSGKPIYLQKIFGTKRYRSTIDKIASVATLI